MIGSIGFLYLLNLTGFIVQNVYLLSDKSFGKWLAYGQNRSCYYVCSLVGVVVTHKFKYFMFSKMFGFECLKARLDSNRQFRVFNVFSFLSFLSSAGILFALGLTLSTYRIPLSQQLMSYIDTIILTLANILLAILNSRKDEDFFE